MPMRSGGPAVAISSDEEHATALREIERLWGAEEGSKDGDLLDALVTLVNHYESRRSPSSRLRSSDVSAADHAGPI